MMDSHDRDPYIDENGNEQKVWAKLTTAQIDWLSTQSKALKEQGCKNGTLILHIPIHAYRTASLAAFKTTEDVEDRWNEGYSNSSGMQYEAISSYPEDDGVFAAIKADGFIKRVLAGHDHVNNWIIDYDGITLIFALKTGAGCYWKPHMNGGTVLKLNENGVYKVSHEYVDISHLL